MSKVSVCIVELASECILDTFILQLFFFLYGEEKCHRLIVSSQCIKYICS